jgi:hypothetical protein
VGVPRRNCAGRYFRGLSETAKPDGATGQKFGDLKWGHRARTPSLLVGPKVGGFGSPLQVALMPDIQFILEDQFQELLMAKPVGRGFLKADIQGLGQA